MKKQVTRGQALLELLIVLPILLLLAVLVNRSSILWQTKFSSDRRNHDNVFLGGPNVRP